MLAEAIVIVGYRRSQPGRTIRIVVSCREAELTRLLVTPSDGERAGPIGPRSLC